MPRSCSENACKATHQRERGRAEREGGKESTMGSFDAHYQHGKKGEVGLGERRTGGEKKRARDATQHFTQAKGIVKGCTRRGRIM
jgi:hypothetical protein